MSFYALWSLSLPLHSPCARSTRMSPPPSAPPLLARPLSPLARLPVVRMATRTHSILHTATPVVSHEHRPLAGDASLPHGVIHLSPSSTRQPIPDTVIISTSLNPHPESIPIKMRPDELNTDECEDSTTEAAADSAQKMISRVPEFLLARMGVHPSSREQTTRVGPSETRWLPLHAIAALPSLL